MKKIINKTKKYFGSYNLDNSVGIPHIEAVEYRGLRQMIEHKAI